MTLEWPPTRRTLLALLGVVAVAGMAFFLRKPDPLAAVPNEPASRAAWACQACGTVYHLTPRERIQFERRASQVVVGGAPLERQSEAADEARTSARELVLGCPDCKQMALRKAYVCPRCGKPFAGVVKGLPQKCACGWDPAPALKPQTAHQPQRGNSEEGER